MGGGVFTSFLLKNPGLSKFVKGVVLSGPLVNLELPDMPIKQESDLNKLIFLEKFVGDRYSARVNFIFSLKKKIELWSWCIVYQERGSWGVHTGMHEPKISLRFLRR